MAGGADQDLSDSFEDLLRQVASAPEVALPLELESGEEIEGSFVVGDRLGAGGMGVVYRARDRRLGRDVAIKLHAGTPDSRAFDRLMGEAQAMAQLSHPNVITVHEVGSIRGHLFIAMEYVEGDSARGWLEAGARSTADIVDVFAQAGRGLEAAHRAGLIHRDFKPDNIFIGGDGRARIGDFGLARATGETGPGVPPAAAAVAPALTATGALMGTLAYMAPEQLAGHAATARSDQFSYCVSLWEALAGERPFAGDTPTSIRASIEAAPRKLPPLPESVPRRVAAALHRGLSPDPEERFPSMTELLAEIDPPPRASRAGWIAFGLAAAGAAAAVLYAAGNHQGAGDVCPADPELGGLWSEERRASLERAFAATELPYAPRSFAAVAALVGEYAAEISRGRERACRAANIHGHVSESIYERQLVCLRGRERRLESLLEVFHRADETVVQNAVEAAGALPPVEVCQDQGYLTTQVKPPSDPAIAAAVDELRRRLGAGAAQIESAKLREAEDALAGAVDRARELGYEPALAEALLVTGRLRQRRDRFAEAEKLLRQSYFAARRGGDDAVAGEAASLLARVVGIDLANRGESSLWQSLAELEVERGTGSAALELTVLESLGAVADFQGDYDRALDLRRRAFDTATMLYGDGHPRVARARVGLASTLQGMGDYGAAAAAYGEALATAEERLGEHHPEVGLILRSLGLVNAHRGEIERSRAELERAVALLSEALGPEALETGYAYLNLGVAHHAANDHRGAIAHYRRALAIVEERLGASHPDASLCHNSIAVAYEGMGELEAALESHRRALEIARGQGATHPQVAIVLGNIGAVLYERGDHAAAATELRAAVAIWDAVSPGNSTAAVPLHILAEALVELGDLAAAEPPARRAVALLEETSSDPARLARARFALARALWRDRGSRPAALELARAAEEGLAKRPDLNPRRLARVRAWLARARGSRDALP